MKAPPAALLLLLVFARLPGGAGAETTSTQKSYYGLDRVIQRLESITSPGPLSRVHAQFDQSSDCEKCHLGASGLDNHLCLDCHAEILERINKRLGLHGRYAGDCYDCHKEHGGRDDDLIVLDEKKFDHDTTRYPLQGRHRKLDCARCHLSGKDRLRHYLIGLPQGCATCHPSPHPPKLGSDCAVCHGQDDWRPATPRGFDHAKQTRFPLRGRHQGLACGKCHKDPVKFGNTPLQCAGCHEDPHAGQFAGRACDACHSENGFRRPNLVFDHTLMTRFALEGSHQAVECRACHPEGRYRPTPASCEACHQDPHGGQFGAPADCRKCHRPAGWTGNGLLFRHQTMTRFALTGRHVHVACRDCHPAGRYRDTPRDCRACHENPHKEQLRICEVCHTTRGFGADTLMFDHGKTSLPLTGLHATTDCSKCHPDLSFSVRGATCATCHDEVEEYYAGKLFSRIAPGKPDPMHGAVPCEECHRAADRKGDPAPIRERCVECHNPHYGNYHDETGRMIAGRLKRLGPGLPPDPRKAADAILRLGAHNVVYSARLIQALGVNDNEPTTGTRGGS